MKNLLFLIATFFVPLLSFGGGLKINLQSGFGSYSMTDLKTLNELTFSTFPLPVEQTDDFPVYWFYQGSIQFCVTENFYLGPVYAYHSTGARYSIADYSGEYLYDNLIDAHTLGLALQYGLIKQNNFGFSVYADGGVGFSKLKMKEDLKITEADVLNSEEVNYKSTGYFLEPGFGLSYKIKFLEPGLQFGYHIPLAGNRLKETKNGGALYLRDGNEAKSRWSGIRLGLTLSFYFSGELTE